MPEITVFSGNITDAGAKFLVNSSNGYLLHGSGTAEQIRKYLGNITDEKELQEYGKTVSKAKGVFANELHFIHNVLNRKPSVFQLESIKYIIDRNSEPLERGDAALLFFNNLTVSNAVGMTYDWEFKERPLPIVPATKESVKKSIQKSLLFAEGSEYDKVAIPIIGARKGGLEKEESAKATLSAIKQHFSEYCDGSIEEIVIVLYDETLQAEQDYFERFFESI